MGILDVIRVQRYRYVLVYYRPNVTSSCRVQIIIYLAYYASASDDDDDDDDGDDDDDDDNNDIIIIIIITLYSYQRLRAYTRFNYLKHTCVHYTPLHW